MGPDEVFPGATAFKLHDTFGFPRELTEEILTERGIMLDLDEFHRMMEEQRDRARRSYKGGDAAAKADAYRSLLSGVEGSEFVGYETDPKMMRDQVAATYRDLHRRVQKLGDTLWERKIDVKPLLIQGPTVELILETAERSASDMIVLGSHGRGGISRMVLGSVSEGVVRRAQCPVLIVPAVQAKSQIVAG